MASYEFAVQQSNYIYIYVQASDRYGLVSNEVVVQPPNPPKKKTVNLTKNKKGFRGEVIFCNAGPFFSPHSIYLSIFLWIDVHIYLSGVSLYSFKSPSIYLSIFIYMFIFITRSTYLSYLYLSIYISIYLYVYIAQATTRPLPRRTSLRSATRASTSARPRMSSFTGTLTKKPKR